MLFNTDPDYSMLRVFGWLCFPWQRPYTKYELSHRSRSCVFMGYSKLHKWSKCFSSTFCVSHHVIFDENVSPFVSQVVVVPLSITNDKLEPLYVTLPLEPSIYPFSFPPTVQQFSTPTNTSNQSPSSSSVDPIPGHTHVTD